MEEMNLFCKNCNEMKVFMVEDIREGEDCWKVITVKCEDCGYTEEIKVNV